MKRKWHVLYLGVAVCLAALCNVLLRQNIKGQSKRPDQLHVESRLPTGDYLPDAKNPLIRVVIKTNGFSHITHSEVQISAESGLVVQDRGEVNPGQVITLTPTHEWFQKGSIRVMPKQEGDSMIIHSLKRGYGTPGYRGTMELYATAEGIVIVNELPVETYLCAVVPSEMPATYHEEALKCQAVCARSYAYCQMKAYGYPEYYAHVDDSVSFQVYGNSKVSEATTGAVNATKGKKLWFQNQVVKTYYYSTSSGHSTSVEAWGTKLTNENQYLKGVSVCDKQGIAYEKDLPWYRWETCIPSDRLCNLIELNTQQEIGQLKHIEITKKGVGDIALEITITGTMKTVKVETENRIRKVLGGEGYQITKQDGTMVKSTKLLPSAFFVIAKNGENYIIKGGGYGHGIGMSQNGSQEMAKAGKTYEQILQFFYPGTQVQ